MWNRKTGLVVVLVIAVVALSGCVGGGDDGGSTPAPTTEAYDGERSAADIAAAALNQSANATAYRVEMTSEIDLSLGSVETRLNGTIDRQRRRARLNTTIESGFTESRTVQTFFDNGTVYVRESADAGWQRRAAGPSTGGQASAGLGGVDHLGQQRRLLTASTITIAGTATLDGAEMYVLRTEPDAGALAGTITGQDAVPSGGLTVENATATLYVSTTTDRLRQVTVRANATAQDQDVSIRSTTRFFDYGIDVELEPPTVSNEST